MAQHYSDDIKAEVLAEWMTGRSVYSIALERKIPKTTIQTWTEKIERPTPVLSQGTREAFEAKLVEAANALLGAAIAFAKKATEEPLGPAHELFNDRLSEIVRASAIYGGAVRAGDSTGQGADPAVVQLVESNA